MDKAERDKAINNLVAYSKDHPESEEFILAVFKRLKLVLKD